jgi:hypothetical protein
LSAVDDQGCALTAIVSLIVYSSFYSCLLTSFENLSF